MTEKELLQTSKEVEEEAAEPYFASEANVRAHMDKAMKRDFEEMTGPESTEMPIPTYASYRYRRKKVTKPER